MSENDRRQTTDVRPLPAMTVHCPHCSTGYLLPSHLIGAQGARVRCPNCQGSFVVLPDGEREPADRRREGPGSAERSERAGRDVADSTTAAVMEAAPPAAGALPQEERSTPEPSAEEPAAVAAAIIGELAATLGEALVDARLAGRVLSRHGPAIVDAYAEYRRRAGQGVSPEPFHLALKACCGVDLMPRREAR